MVSTEVLELLLTARYIGRPAFQSFSNDIEGVVHQSNALTRVGSAFSALGDVMLGAGATVALGLGMAVKQAAEYQQSLTRIQSVTHYTAPQMQQLSNTIMQISDTYGQSSQDIADASYLVLSHMGGLGASFQDVMNAQILPAIGAFVEASGAGKAGSVSWLTAANDAVHALTGMHQSPLNWGNDLGIMTLAENSSGLTQQQMSSAFTRFMPLAGLLGMNFGQSTDLIAAIASSGVFGAREGTELSSGLSMAFSGAHLTALTKLIGNPSRFFKNGQFTDFTGFIDTLATKLMAVKDPVQRMTDAISIFGRVGAKTFMEFLATPGQGGKTAMGIYQQLEQKRIATGNPMAYMLDIAFKQAQGPQAQFAILRAALQNLAIVIGTALLPVVMQLVVWLTNLVTTIQNFATAHPKLTKDAALAAVPTLLGGGTAMKGVGGLLQFLGQRQLQHAEEQGRVSRENAGKLSKYQQALNNWKNKVALGNQQTDAVLAKDTATKTAQFEQAHTKWLSDIGALGQTQRDTLNKLDVEARKDLDAFPTKLSKAAGETNTAFFGRAKSSVAGLGIKPKKGETHAAFIGRASAALKKYHNDTYANYVAADKGARKAFEDQRTALGAEPQLARFMTPFSGTLPTLPTKPVKELEAAAHQGVLGHIGGLFSGLAKHGAAAGKAPITALEKVGKFLNRPESEISQDIHAAAGRVGGFFGKHLTRLSGFAEHHGKALSSFAFPELNKVADAGAGPFEKLGAMGKDLLAAPLRALKGLVTGFGALLKGGLSLIPMLAGLGGALLVVLAVVLAVAGVIAIVVLSFIRYRKEVEHLGQVMGHGLQPVFKAFEAIVKTVGAVVVQAWSKAAPAIDKAMGTLFKVIPKLIPLLIGIGAVIGFVVSVILAVVTGLVNGFLSALPNIIGFFTSIISFIGDFVKLVIDLFTNWNAIPQDLQALGADILGIFTNALSAVGTFIWGFILGIIDFFQYLWNVLTRHSIIPDMVNEIINWFLQLPAQLPGIILSLITTVIMQMGQWELQMVQAGMNLVLGLAQGVLGAAGSALDAIGSVASNIWGKVTSFFGIASPSVLMAGAGMNIDQGLAQGMNSGSSLTTAAAGNVASGVNTQFADMATAGCGSFADLQNCASNHLNQMAQATPAQTAAVFNNMVNTIKPYQLQILQQVRKQMDDIHGIVSDYGSLIANSSYQAGVSISQGMADGIMARKQATLLAAENLASTVNTGFKGHLQISSPSKVFFAHGVNTVLGYIQGLVAHYPDIQRAWAELGLPNTTAGGSGAMNIDTLHVGNIADLQPVQPAPISTYQRARAIQYERLNQRTAVQPLTQQQLMNQFDLQYRFAYQHTQ